MLTLKVDDYARISDEDKPKAQQALETFLSKYKKLWITPGRPTLGEARGRVLLLNRITRDNLRFGAPIDWSDNTAGKMISPDRSPELRAYSGYVQDKYDVENEDDKWKVFLAAIGKKPENGLLLNFASALKNSVINVNIQEQFLNYFGEPKQRFSRAQLGWSLWDFTNSDYVIEGDGLIQYVSVTDLIIDANYNYTFYGYKFKTI